MKAFTIRARNDSMTLPMVKTFTIDEGLHDFERSESFAKKMVKGFTIEGPRGRGSVLRRTFAGGSR